MAEWDPVLPPDKAGEYCGCSAKTLEKFNLDRHPLPQLGLQRQRWGYRLSTLNAFLDQLKDIRKRPAKIASQSLLSRR